MRLGTYPTRINLLSSGSFKLERQTKVLSLFPNLITLYLTQWGRIGGELDGQFSYSLVIKGEIFDPDEMYFQM